MPATTGESVRPPAVHRPPARDLALMVVGAGAVSTSGPLIVACAAPALAIAFWRNAMASALLIAWVLVRRRGELRALTRRERRLAMVAGVLLAAHFASWVPSLSFTTVASSTALVASQPVWAAVVARIRGDAVPAIAWVGIACSVLGVVVITGVDVSVSARALVGDLLALLGGVLAAAYVTVGAQVRTSVSTAAYTAVCYPTAALLLLLGCLAGRQAVIGYPTLAWGQLAAMTVGPQLLGHSVFNRVLETTSAMVVSLAILFEVPGAALLAALVLGQQPPLGVLPGAALLLVGVALVLRAGSRTAPAPVPE